MQREPLHYQFVRIAKQYGDKLAFIDRGLQRNFTYSRTLTASLILAAKLKTLDEPLVGVMLPTSAGAAIVLLALLMNGKTPVLLNYSTVVQANVEYARKKCDFYTVITAKGCWRNSRRRSLTDLSSSRTCSTMFRSMTR